MLPTPLTSHVSYDQVYEPAEDSYLLLDTLSSATETAFLRAHLSGHPTVPLVLEVGTGSGVVLAFITAYAEHVLGRSDVVTLGTDLNIFACGAASMTVVDAVEAIQSMPSSEAREDTISKSGSGVFLDTLKMDLASSCRPNIVDVLIFNPPYVPTEHLPTAHTEESSTRTTFDRDSHLLSLSYAGGTDGMEVTNRLLSQLPSILSSDRGVAYVLLCAQNRPEEVKSWIREWEGGWRAETVGSSGKKAGWEKLSIIRIWKGV
ncbi:hypothetical protein LTR28_012045 [Elasticomyces elasticus]|nr:hypothetical protein LTR28_012045 [Elasticomyces elasticus]